MSVSVQLPRPAADECAPYYAGYISEVPDGDVLARLESQIQDFMDLLSPLDDVRAGYRYAEGKWTIRDIVGHLIDAEWVFGSRVRHFARGDTNPLPGFDQDDYVKIAEAESRSLAELLGELAAVRAASLALFRGLSEEAWLRRGIASGNEFTARSLPWIIAGHELHHRRVLQERYL